MIVPVVLHFPSNYIEVIEHIQHNNHIEVKQEEEQLLLSTVFLLLSEAIQIVEYQYFYSDQNIFPFYGFKSSKNLSYW